MGQDDTLGGVPKPLEGGETPETKTTKEILVLWNDLLVEAKDDLKLRFSIIIQEANRDLKLALTKHERGIAGSREQGVSNETREEVKRMADINLQEEISRIKQNIREKISNLRLK